MRVKLLFLAASLVLIVLALIFGADMCTKVGKQQQRATEKAGEEAAGSAERPNPTEGGVQNVNQNLRKMKKGMQDQMDERGDRLDDRINRSAGQR